MQRTVRNLCWTALPLILGVLAPQPSWSQATVPATAAPLGTNPAAVPMAMSLDSCWSSWLTQNNVHEGFDNPRGLVIASGRSALAADKGSPAWIDARSAAFTAAELNARRALADFMATGIKSERHAFLYEGNGEAPPPVRQAIKILSNAERLTTLTGLALDNAIRQFDPNWNGAGQSDAQRRQEAIRVETNVTNRVAAESAVFAAGAFTARSCEGPDPAADGKYSVLVGMVWSPRLATIAESLINPAVQVPPVTPAPPLSAQFDAMTAKDPNWLAYTG